MVSEIGKELKKNYYGEYRKGMTLDRVLLVYLFMKHISLEQVSAFLMENGGKKDLHFL